MVEWLDIPITLEHAWMGWSKINPQKSYTLLSFFKRFYINNNDRTAHFVCHSKLKELDIVDFYKIKQTNENTEAEMKEIDVKQGKNAYSEDDNFDEAIPIQVRKERTT